MITRTHRFHGHASLPAVYKRAQVVRGSLMTLKYTSRPTNKTYRAAVIVSRKVHKSAVVRNRIRRRVYEIVRSWESVMLTQSDLVFLIYSDKAAVIDHNELVSQVQTLLLKAGLLPKQ